MGLDSVELILEIENFFEITIPDKEAERMVTVQHVVDYLVPTIPLVNRNVDLKKELFNSLKTALVETGNSLADFSFNDKIFDLIPPTDQQRWNTISSKLNLRLPSYKADTYVGAFFNKILPGKNIDYTSITVDRFIDLIAAENYKELLFKGAIQNEYEVYIGMMGIVTDKLGVYSYEIFPHSSFVDDFGID